MAEALTITDEQRRDIGLNHEAAKRANADPLPGVLYRAFDPKPIDIGSGLTVRPVVASDWKALKWLESPVWKAFLELQKDEKIREEIQYTDEEQYEMAWQFTHTPKEVRGLMAKGRDIFRETCVDWADTITFAALPDAINAIQRQIILSFTSRPTIGDDEDLKKKTPL
jgi:hypothetical protein